MTGVARLAEALRREANELVDGLDDVADELVHDGTDRPG